MIFDIQSSVSPSSWPTIGILDVAVILVDRFTLTRNVNTCTPSQLKDAALTFIDEFQNFTISIGDLQYTDSKIVHPFCAGKCCVDLYWIRDIFSKHCQVNTTPSFNSMEISMLQQPYLLGQIQLFLSRILLMS